MDFIVGAMKAAIEVKASKRMTSHDLKGLRELKKEYPAVKKRIVVCMEPQARFVTEPEAPKGKNKKDGIDVLPYSLFVKKLWGE